MTRIGFALCAAALLSMAPSIAAAASNRVWTLAQAQRAAKATADCSGWEHATRTRYAPEIIQSLPKAGETVLQLSEERAYDIYSVAGALLKPAIPHPERSFDPSASLTCTADPATGVELMNFLTADGPANRRGPNNSFYWLGQAYRHGAGVAQDLTRSRRYFLTSRILGNFLLTSEDWGDQPSDTLMSVLARPENRAMLESAASAGRDEAQFLLGEFLLATDKARARASLRASAAQRNARASRRLSELEAQGAFGAPDFMEAARMRAWLASPAEGDTDFQAMLDAARAFNGGEVATVTRKLSPEDLGVAPLLAQLHGAPRDSVVGKVRSRALLAPDGRIIYTEVTSVAARRFSIGRDTRHLFSPKNLKPIGPHIVDGKALFAWIDLPTIEWR